MEQSKIVNSIRFQSGSEEVFDPSGEDDYDNESPIDIVGLLDDKRSPMVLFYLTVI